MCVGLTATLSPRYRGTNIAMVCCLSDGDHVVVSTPRTGRQSGIVVGVAVNTRQVELVQFPSSERARGPGRVVINDVDSVYRYDYDIAVGVSGEAAKETALAELSEPSEPMPYNDADQFAVWCKTSLSPVTVGMALAGFLASARMTGRVWTWVRAVDELRRGDHVSYNSGAVYYYQHAIVTQVEGRQVSVIYLVGNESEPTRCVVKSETIDVTTYIRKEQLCAYFYDVRQWFDADAIVSRAETMLGSTADRLKFKDPEHFAIWCRTGSPHFHC